MIWTQARSSPEVWDDSFWQLTSFLRRRFLVLVLAVALIIIHQFVQSISVAFRFSMIRISPERPFVGPFLHWTIVRVSVRALGTHRMTRHLYCPINASVFRDASATESCLPAYTEARRCGRRRQRKCLKIMSNLLRPLGTSQISECWSCAGFLALSAR